MDAMTSNPGKLPSPALPQDGVHQNLSPDHASPEACILQAPFTAAERALGVLCSWNQEQMYLLQQQMFNKCTYNAPRGVTLDGKLEFEALQQALSSLVQRHEALRTGFLMVKGAPCQFVMRAEKARPQVQVILIQTMCHSNIQAALREHAMSPFDLAKPPLLLAILVQVRLFPRVLLLLLLLAFSVF